MGTGGEDNGGTPRRPGWMKDGAARRPKERKGFRRRTPREQPQWLPGRGAIPPPAPPPPARGPLTAHDVGPTTTPADWTPAAPAAPTDGDVGPPTGRKQRRKPEPFRRSAGGTVFGPAEPPPTLEMESVGADGPTAGARRRAAHYAAAPPVADEVAPTVADRLASSKTVVLGALVLALLLTAGAAALLLPDDSDSGQAAADENDDDPGSGFTPSTDDDSDNGVGQASSSSTSEPDSTTTTDTTSSTTTTTTLLGVVDPTPPTTTPTTAPTTTRPTTSTSAAPTTTTTQPRPVINSFNAQVEQFGCGGSASPANISWSTTGATSVTLGRVGQTPSGVPVDGQLSDVCVNDNGENWRLTATGPGGTTTQDLNINPQ